MSSGPVDGSVNYTVDQNKQGLFAVCTCAWRSPAVASAGLAGSEWVDTAPSDTRSPPRNRVPAPTRPTSI